MDSLNIFCHGILLCECMTTYLLLILYYMCTHFKQSNLEKYYLRIKAGFIIMFNFIEPDSVFYNIQIIGPNY